MKLNNNLRRCITSFFVILFAAVLVFSVSASPIDSNGNRFVDFNNYAEYTFSDDGATVNVEVSFPSMWNNTFVDQANPEFHPHWFWGNEFTITDTVMPWLKINMHPLGGEMGWNTGIGEQLRDCYFIDLQYFPSNTVFRYNFSLSVGQTDLNLDEHVYTRYFFFVDSAGKVVDVGVHYFSPITDGKGNFTWTEQIKFNTFPKNAVGFVPMFVARNTGWASGDVTVRLSSFEFSFPMSALQYTDQQNKQMQTTLNSIQDAIDNQNQALGDLANGTPAQNQQAQDAVGGLNSSTDKLGDLGDQMSSVDKPELNSNDFSAGSLVPQTSLVVLSSPFLVLWENKQLLAMLTIVVSLVLVSWVFFGKKG